jgi:hypothetical protein
MTPQRGLKVVGWCCSFAKTESTGERLLHPTTHDEHSEHGAAQRDWLRHPHQGGDHERLRAEWMTTGQSGAGKESIVPAYSQHCSAGLLGGTRRRDCLELACQAWACQHAVLRRMAREELGRGLLIVESVDQLCDACLAGMQRHIPFPTKAQWRAEHILELVHGDLCGPISPTMPSGSSYFLLLVDDKSQFMWVTTLVMKAQAATAIKEFQSRAEAESGCKLCALHYRGEFTSREFVEYCAEDGVH